MAKKSKLKAKSSSKPARVTGKSASKTMAARKKAKTAKKPAARKPAAKKIDPLNRKQYTSLTPMLTVQDVRRAVDFYTKAFGFKVRGMMEGPGGMVMHAELRLRDTTLMLGPESAEQHTYGARSIGGTPVTIYILVGNADATFNDAIAAGGQVLMPVMDMFWGDRCGMVGDPDGNKWMIATHKANPTAKQMQAAMKAQMENLSGGQAASAAAASESQY
jgi:uncharacterized glyoxalase superfamily protein PhnB